jgi:hypothetical protein
MKLFYCDTCGLRIPAEEIPADAPEPADGKYFCSKHRAAPIPEPIPTPAKPPSKSMPVPVPQAGYSSRNKMTPVARANPSARNTVQLTDSRRMPAATPAPGASNKLIWGGAGLVFVVCVGVLAFAGGSKPAETRTAAPGHLEGADPLRNQLPIKTPAPAPVPENTQHPTTDTATLPVTPTPATPATAAVKPAPKAPAPVKTAPVVPATPIESVTPTDAIPNPVPPDDPRNLLKNPTVEDPASRAWDPYGKGKIVQDILNAHTGKYCIRVEPGATNAMRQIVTGLSPLTKYTVTAWLKGTNALLGVKDYGGPELNQATTKNQYEQLSITFAMDAKTKSAKIFVHNNASTPAYADDFLLIAFTTAAEVPKAPEEPPAEKFEVLQENVLTLLQQNKVDAALTSLAEAKADPAFSTLLPDLDAAIACAHGYDETVKAGSDGVQKLSDGRAFTFKKRTGRDTSVGGSTKAAVKEFKDGEFVIETKDGGIVATEKFLFDELTDQCRLDLAAQTLAPGSEKECRLAFAEFLMFRAGRGGTLADIRTRIERARKDAAFAAQNDFIQHALDTLLLNQRIEVALKKVDAALQAGDAAQAHTLWEALTKEFGLTPLHIKKYFEDHRDLELVPGLWASYFSGPTGKEFGKYHLARAETKLNLDWGTRSPDPSIPVDFFTGKYCGFLRAPKAGDYTFLSHTDDLIELTIDGKRILENGANAPAEIKIALTAGDHTIKIFYREFSGGAHLWLRWKLDGGFDVQEIPASALWHDPSQKEQYQKPEK